MARNPGLNMGLTRYIGTDDANNEGSTSNVVANRDGTLLERSEFIMNNVVADYAPDTYVPGLGYKVTKSSSTAATTDAIFDIAGQCLLTLVTGEVTTVIGTVTTCKLNIKTDAVDLCAATTITSDADGTMYALSGDFGTVMNGADAPTLRVVSVASASLNPIVVGNAGGTAVIEQTLDQTGTGVILWTAWYLPLEASAAVTASA